MSIDCLPVALIEEFLHEYQPANLGRSMSADERGLVEEVLFDFIVTDLVAESSAECAMALANIRQLVDTAAPALLDDIEYHIRLIERASRRASVQSARREKSFDIMREHLAILADREQPQRANFPPPARGG